MRNRVGQQRRSRDMMRDIAAQFPASTYFSISLSQALALGRGSHTMAQECERILWVGKIHSARRVIEPWSCCENDLGHSELCLRENRVLFNECQMEAHLRIVDQTW